MHAADTTEVDRGVTRAWRRRVEVTNIALVDEGEQRADVASVLEVIQRDLAIIMNGDPERIVLERPSAYRDARCARASDRVVHAANGIARNPVAGDVSNPRGHSRYRDEIIVWIVARRLRS